MTKLHEYFHFNKLYAKEIGIEVELEGDYLPGELRSHWHVKNDGSLRGNGREYILRGPIDRTDVKHRLTYLYERLGLREAPSDRCGVHVHLNCQHLTQQEIFRIATLYFILEDVLVHWCGEDREGNLFCLRAQDAEYLMMLLIEDKGRGQFNRTVGGGGGKYSALNLQALGVHGTLEFRSLRSPQTPDRINKWIEVLCRIKDQALKAKSSSDFIVRCSELGGREWLTEMLGEHAEEFMNPDVEEMLIEGARRTQTLAFTPFGSNKARNKEEDLAEVAGGNDLIVEAFRRKRDNLLRAPRWEAD